MVDIFSILLIVVVAVLALLQWLTHRDIGRALNRMDATAQAAGRTAEGATRAAEAAQAIATAIRDYLRQPPAAPAE